MRVMTTRVSTSLDRTVAHVLQVAVDAVACRPTRTSGQLSGPHTGQASHPIGIDPVPGQLEHGSYHGEPGGGASGHSPPVAVVERWAEGASPASRYAADLPTRQGGSLIAGASPQRDG